MAMNDFITWWRSVYDRLIAIVIFAVLVSSLVYLAVRIGIDRAQQSEWIEHIRNMVPEHPDAKPVNSNIFARTTNRLENPCTSVYSNWTVQLLVPETRVICPYCKQPIPIAVTNCPICESAQPQEPDEVEGYDGDSDGMPNKWETQYGFDPKDPKDAEIDSDGDGFINRLECRNRTDPRNPDSHPGYEARIYVKSINAVPFKFLFMSIVTLPDGTKSFGLNTLNSRSTVFVKMGGTIMPEGFKVTDFKTNYTEKLIGTNMTVREDAHLLTLVRGDKTIVLTKGKEIQWIDLETTVVFELENKEFPRKKQGESFDLRNNTYQIIKIDKERHIVVIKRVSDGKEFTLERAAGKRAGDKADGGEKSDKSGKNESGIAEPKAKRGDTN